MSEQDLKESIDNETELTINPEWIRISDDQYGKRKAIRRIVSSIPLFRGLSRHNWHELSNLFHLRQFKDGEIIFETGTPGLGMYVIIEGEVRILGEQVGTEVVFARLDSGDFFGELSLVDDAPRSATAVAKGETRLIGIFRPQLQQLIRHRPKLGVTLLERLAGIVAKRLRESNDLLEETRKIIASEDS